MFEDILPIIMLVLFAVVTLVQLMYYYLGYARFAFLKKKKAVAMDPVPVSIVMVVKDAASVLMKSLPRLLSQQYGQYELVIVDDNSKDETELLVLEYKNQYPNIKMVNLDSAVTTIRGRKFAISMGIRCATYEHILLTDPECCPTSTQWLKLMAGNFVGRNKIVLGYSTYERRNSPFNRLLHFDTLVNAVQYFSLAKMHSTYRGDARNMAFARSLFTAQTGFAAHNHIRYGEEDIFISRAATRDNTEIEYSQDAFTVLQRGANHRYWRDHKEGLYFTRRFNTLRNRLFLNTYGVINLLFYITLSLAIVVNVPHLTYLFIVLGIAAARILSQYMVFGFAAKKLNERQVIPGLLLYDLIFAILNPIYYLSAKVNQQRFL